MMSQYSVLNPTDIIKICSQYGIQKVNSFSILSGGSENTNYLLKTGKGQFVLTICEQKTMQSARELAYLLEYLAKNNFESSKLVRTKSNDPISKWSGKPVMLKVFLKGKVIKDLPKDILENIGFEIGRLHQMEAPAYLPKILNYGIEFFHEVGQYAMDSQFELWIKEIENYVQPFLSRNLPKSLIHSDIFFSNIIINEDLNSVQIMDFEEAANYYRIFDIGMTIIGLCTDTTRVDLEKANILLKGYQKQINLTEMERKSLQAFTVYAAASMTFWRHRNFNHVNPNPKMYDHYLGLKVLADYVKRIPNAIFLKILM